MFSFLLCAVLTGPVPDSGVTLKLTIHLGNDKHSAIARSELSRFHEYFLSKRLKIEQRYRIVIDEDAWREPEFSIGRGGERQRFRPGTFRSSGTFIRALESICEVDTYQRQQEDGWYSTGVGMVYDPARIHEFKARKPVPWPTINDPVELTIPEDVFGVDFVP